MVTVRCSVPSLEIPVLFFTSKLFDYITSHQPIMHHLHIIHTCINTLPKNKAHAHVWWYNLYRVTVDLPKKHGRGGQSALRFARLRLEKRHNYVRKVAELGVQFFITNDRVCNILPPSSHHRRAPLSSSSCPHFLFRHITPLPSLPPSANCVLLTEESIPFTQHVSMYAAERVRTHRGRICWFQIRAQRVRYVRSASPSRHSQDCGCVVWWWERIFAGTY